VTDQRAALLVGGAITVLALPTTATLLGRGQSGPSSVGIANHAKTPQADDHG
jgi:hypothetical protein